jgi:hypothetical protein
MYAQPIQLTDGSNVITVMCYFITIAVLEEDFEKARRVVPRGFEVLPVANLSANAGLPTGYSTFLLVSGGCSCGLYQSDVSPSLKRNEVYLRQKFAKKGSSESKIDRAIEQSISNHAKSNDFLGFREDFVGILRNMALQTCRFAFLVHWYDGNVVDEKVHLEKPQTITVARLGAVVPEIDQWFWVDG